MYLYQILNSIELLSVAIIRHETKDQYTNPYIVGKTSLNYVPRCYSQEFTQFGGNALEWLIIEVLVFWLFLTTMLFTMCKSRFVSVGMDNSD